MVAPTPIIGVGRKVRAPKGRVLRNAESVSSVKREQKESATEKIPQATKGRIYN